MSNNIEDNTSILNQTTQILNKSPQKETQKEINDLNNYPINIIDELNQSEQDDLQNKINIQELDDMKILHEISGGSIKRQFGVSFCNPISKQTSSKKYLKNYDDHFELFQEFLQYDYENILSQNNNMAIQIEENRSFSQEFDKKCQIKNDLKKTSSDTCQNKVNKKLRMDEFMSNEKSHHVNQHKYTEQEQNTSGKRKDCSQNIVNQTPYLNSNKITSGNTSNQNKQSPQVVQSYKNIDRKQNEQLEQLFDDQSDDFSRIYGFSKIKDSNDSFSFCETSQHEENSKNDLKSYIQNPSIYYTIENNSIEMEQIKRQLYYQAYQDMLQLKYSSNKQLFHHLNQINEQNSDITIITSVRNKYLQKVRQEQQICN